MRRRLIGSILVMLTLLAGLGSPSVRAQDSRPPEAAGLETAVFAGGCFWCMVHPFDSLDGVSSVTSGYTGGTLANPTYEQVTAGGTGHIEAVEVVFDPEVVDYDTLLEIYWRNVDPFDGKGQFCDRGASYRPAIFVAGDEQKTAAEASKRQLETRFDRSIRAEILPAAPFYQAEDYHQDYYKKNPVRYKYYRYTCGRDQRLERVWGDEAGGGKG